MTCPANAHVPESVVGTILYTPCEDGYRGQMEWICSAPEQSAVWVRSAADCVSMTPPEGRVFINFILTLHQVNNIRTDNVLNAMRQAIANVLLISTQDVRIWEKKELSRRLLEDLEAYGQIETTPENEYQLTLTLANSLQSIDEQLRMMGPDMFTSEYHTSFSEYPTIPPTQTPSDVPTTLPPTTLPPTTLPPTTLPPTTLPPTTLPPTTLPPTDRPTITPSEIPSVTPTTIAPTEGPTEVVSCGDEFITVRFTRVSGVASCEVRVSDLSGKSNGLLLIANINDQASYCLNPGYYYIGCDAAASVNVNYLTSDQTYDLTTSPYSVSLAIHQINSPWTSVPENHERPDFDKNIPLSGKPAYPADPTNDLSDFTCDAHGYLNYLNMWSETQKCTSRDVTTLEFQTRLEYFIDSCEKIHDWNLRSRYTLEFTFYADWHPMEFEELTTTKQRYSGIKTPVPFTIPVYNNSNFRYLMPSSDPCDDVIEGGNQLRELICKPQNCSVSWAFAVTNSIEYAIKKLYLDTYDQLVEVALSAQELIDCVGKDHGIQGNACSGMPIVWGFDYVFENGIAFRQYYPHTNVEAAECRMIEDEHKYHIAGYEKPHVYNKLGLFDLVMKGPTAVSLGLDPEYFQYYRNDRAEGPYFDTAYWRPSVYGVVVEYNQYAIEGQPDFIEWPYFAIETRLRACDSFVFRLPIYETTSDANIAGIAGFAIRPVVNELLPTPQPPA